MKKLIVLASIAAAIFGIRKMMAGKNEEETALDAYASDNGYAPQPQP